MAVVHRTTLKPTKLELLGEWLPGRPWYLGGADGPVLDRAGGFRLDDPEGEVGIEFMVVTDVSGPLPVAYQVPFTYRAAPLEGAGHALVGTTEHGVLGRRWVYDGAHDPVLVAQLCALLDGSAEPQAQSLSDTPDPSVVVDGPSGAGSPLAAVRGRVPLDVVDGPFGVEVRAGGGGGEGGQVVRIHRVLRPHPAGTDGTDGTGDTPDDGAWPGTVLARVSAGWTLPDGSAVRGVFASAVRP
ncbi:maltokinase N-terminal cap-like domain-containing protein [Streptomyces fuscigenes]|uniref:maltokinase N-terminal cap-like domain-containing protein n=1 Tax=Streptomyces fuscigenes TaxID=1528880 RepID=UPI001F2FC043|nr:1,4-alpha-glucan branching protein [Streptomyces fuscigenes]MCF3964584.1 1,4-alpha-glucan branching protein [Streptomyces fuscigenes]